MRGNGGCMQDLARMTDSELRQQVRNLAQVNRVQTIDLADHLGEVDARQLYLRWGYSSLWDYCQRELHLHDGVAHLRITLARLMRRKPEVKSLLVEGRLGLCAACELWPHVDEA